MPKILHIMHKYYGGIPQGVPLSLLCDMLTEAGRWEIENQLKPVYYLRLLMDELKGVKTEITLQDMVNDVLAPEKPVRSAEEITNDFAKIIQKDRRA